MHTQHLHKTQGVSRRELLKAGLATGMTLSTWPLSRPTTLWGAEAGQPKRGGILRVRGYDPVYFDPHLTLSFKTQTTLSFVYSRLVRHKVGADVPPGPFTLEPDLAEGWEAPDDTTYGFHLRKGVKWHHKPHRRRRVGAVLPQRRRHRGGVENPGVRRLYRDNGGG